MDRPDDIPQWAWDYALEAYKAAIDRPIWAGSGFEMIARAIVAAVEANKAKLFSGEKPDDIPQSEWDTSIAFKSSVDVASMGACEFIARARMDAKAEEREACAQIAKTYGANMSIWMTSEWPTAKLAANYAGQDISAVIRNRKGA